MRDLNYPMKYPVILVGVATAMLLVGVAIHIHANGKYTDKMFYHTTGSNLYTFDEVFAEQKLADRIQLWSIIAGGAACVWMVALNISRDRKRR